MRKDALALIQTDSVFQIVIDPQRGARGRIDIAPPAASIGIIAAATGQSLRLGKKFSDPGHSLSGNVVNREGSVLGQVEWRQHYEDGNMTELELFFDHDFWVNQVALYPGKYTIRTAISGLQHLDDGSPVTPQELGLDFIVEPGVLITSHDAEAHPHKDLDFPPRCLQIGHSGGSSHE